jgi:hypothetical protein
VVKHTAFPSAAFGVTVTVDFVGDGPVVGLTVVSGFLVIPVTAGVTEAAAVGLTTSVGVAAVLLLSVVFVGAAAVTLGVTSLFTAVSFLPHPENRRDIVITIHTINDNIL